MAAKKRGRPLKWGGSEEDSQVFTLRLPKSLHAAVRTYANLRGEAINDVLLEVIGAWFKKLPQSAEISALIQKARAQKPKA